MVVLNISCTQSQYDGNGNNAQLQLHGVTSYTSLKKLVSTTTDGRNAPTNIRGIQHGIQVFNWCKKSSADFCTCFLTFLYGRWGKLS